MRNSYSFVLAVLITVCSFVSTKADAVLPANLDLPGTLVPDMTQLYAASPTFRAQCERIAAAPKTLVTVFFDVNMRHSCRAFTIFTRRRGLICAEVHVPAASNQFAELLSHELEHILEQIEGVNLRVLARVRGSGVREVEAELFETDRAQRAGKTVAGELRLARELRRAN